MSSDIVRAFLEGAAQARSQTNKHASKIPETKIASDTKSALQLLRRVKLSSAEVTTDDVVQFFKKNS